MLEVVDVEVVVDEVGGTVVAARDRADEVGAGAAAAGATVGGTGPAPVAAARLSRPLQPAPHATLSAVASRRATAADGLRPCDSSKAMDADTWGAAIEVPAEEA